MIGGFARPVKADREKPHTGKHKKRAPTRPLYGNSHHAGSSKGDISVSSRIGGDNQEVQQVCVTGFGCLDQYAVTNITDFVDKYNAQVAAASQGNGGQALEDFQYLQAMVAACAADNQRLEANCSGQAYITLNTRSAQASVAAYEQANGIPAWKTAAAAGGTVLEAALGALGSASAAKSGGSDGGSSCMMPSLMGGGRRSFSADTPVLLGDGTATKQLKDVKVGDEVLATDPETGAQGPRTVTDVWVHQDDLYTLIIDGKQLTVTEDHPIWDVTDQRWERADQLDPGDLLHTATNANAHVDSFHTETHQIAAAYNLTVDDLHTYYVLAGDVPVLVHNDSTPWGQPGHSNYVLVDKTTNKVYYAGRFGPNESAASVVGRHAKTGRFRPGLDRIEVVPSTRTYGEARLMEDDLAAMYGTRTGGGRGNAIYPMQQKKREAYYNYASTC